MAPFVLIGNPASRRIAHFAHAVVRAGHTPPRIVAWIDVARDAERALASMPNECVVRIDSFGEDFEVERALLRRGAGRAPANARTMRHAEIDACTFERGRIVAPRQTHEGFLAALEDIERIAKMRSKWRFFTPIAAIREMFDKSAASKALSSIGVPVAPSIEAPSSPRELRTRLCDARIDAAWIKLGCGSSASCLALWEMRPRKDVLITTMERTDRGLFNSKNVRRYSRTEDIESLVGFLLREGAHIEVDIRKATVRDRWVDCRIVSIAGESEVVVTRISRYPMTNLHLGAARAGRAFLEAHGAAHAVDAAIRSSARIRAHYRAIHVGVDVAFTRGFADHVVLEANAFGDCLHGATLGDDGVYAKEIRSIGREA